jgi:hypothetical protein
MFWPKEHLFNFFKRFMLSLWLATIGSLLFTIVHSYERHPRADCGNRTDRQLFQLSLYQAENSTTLDQFDLSVERCLAPSILIALNVLLTLSTFRHWFQLNLLQKWFSLDYVLNVFLLLCMYGWCRLIHYQPPLTPYLYTYVALHALQALLALWHELRYFRRYLPFSLAVEDPLFDPKIISYSIFKIIYMCSYLVAHRYPQSRCGAFSYQLYKWSLLALAQSAALCTFWCYVRTEWSHSASDPHLTLLALILVLFLFAFVWRTERTLRFTYPCLALLWTCALTAVIQLAIGGQWSGSAHLHHPHLSSAEDAPLSRSDETNMRDMLRSALDISKSDEDASVEHGEGASGSSTTHFGSASTAIALAIAHGWFSAALAGILLLVLSLLAVQFARAFKQQRAYNDLFGRECGKTLTQVLDQCRNKEYFVIKYNFKIKYKCVACGGLSLDLVCPDCHQAIFHSSE